jgi:hypothetical protein
VTAAPRLAKFTHADLVRLRTLTREAIAQCREAIARCRATAEEADACRVLWGAARAELEAETAVRPRLRAQWPPQRNGGALKHQR